MSSGNVMEKEIGEGSSNPTGAYSGEISPHKATLHIEGAEEISTPPGGEERRGTVEVHRVATTAVSPRYSTTLRAPLSRSPHAPGPQMFDKQYMPFAAGFSHMADEAAVYRSSRLHAINPTAAVTEDISYLWTLDSGRVTPAALASNPDTSAEFVRNTATQSQGGMFKRLMKPIE